MSKTITLYPVVSAHAHWSCPECKSHNLRAAYSVVEYSSYRSPMVVMPDGKKGADHENGETGDAYESSYTDDYLFECSDCFSEMPYEHRPNKGSVAELILNSSLKEGVVVRVPDHVDPGFTFATCDTDGTLKKWKHAWGSSPECRVDDNAAVWSSNQPEKEDNTIAFAMLPVKVTAIIPSNLYHQVLWIPAFWDMDVIANLQKFIEDLEPLPVNEDWWMVRRVNHKMVY